MAMLACLFVLMLLRREYGRRTGLLSVCVEVTDNLFDTNG